MGATVVVFVSGGVAQSFVSDDPNIRVILSDLDSEEFGDGEPWQSEQAVYHVGDLSVIPEPGDRVLLLEGGEVNVFQLAGVYKDYFSVIADGIDTLAIVRDKSRDDMYNRAWKEVAPDA